MKARPILIPLLIVFAAGTLPALAQDKGTLEPKPLPPLEHPGDPRTPAKQLFARKLLPSAQPTKVIGEYAKGCIAGAVPWCEGLYVASGHGPWGISTGPATARQVADVVLGLDRAGTRIDPAFAPGRFGPEPGSFAAASGS